MGMTPEVDLRYPHTCTHTHTLHTYRHCTHMHYIYTCTAHTYTHTLHTHTHCTHMHCTHMHAITNMPKHTSTVHTHAYVPLNMEIFLKEMITKNFSSLKKSINI